VSWFIFALRLVLGSVLLVAGALKVSHPSALAADIAGFRLLPAGIVLPIAIGLPPLEMIFGFYLVAGLFTRIAGWVTCAMFVAYAAAIASAVVRHIPANCGCFGPSDQSTASWGHVALDAALAAIGAAIARYAPGPLSLDRLLARNATKET
jgi:uncharacterized membrane protein YphA (DoxX/SURF4 family)